MNKKLVACIVSFLILVIVGISALLVLGKEEIVISVPGEKENIIVQSSDNKSSSNTEDNIETINVEYGGDFNLPAVKAYVKDKLFNKEGKEIQVEVKGEVDKNKLGEYPVTFIAKNEKLTKEIHRKYKVVDTVAPVIELVSDPENYTSPKDEYEEEGFSAIDNYDGDITEKVERAEADGKVTYTVSDSSGNKTTVTREIIYKDTEPPVIELAQANTIQRVSVGGTYSDPGYTATDDCDGDITEKVEVSGDIDSSTPGVYTINYTVKDSYGNEGTASRTVYVINGQGAGVDINPGDKVVYLTFDDGPSPYTMQLLDVLDKYNVKVTFFVTGARSDCRGAVTEAYRRGHTIAIHSLTHNYAQIYASEDAYYDDLNAMSDLIVSLTGQKPWIVRFPGGSSNSVSRNYNTGIMSRLTQSIGAMGYKYFDWNVSSGDAGGAISTSEVYNNVVSGISSHNVSVVLQHDTQGFSVAAVEDIIVWGLANGYTFLPITDTTPAVHHGVNN